MSMMEIDVQNLINWILEDLYFNRVTFSSSLGKMAYLQGCGFPVIQMNFLDFV